MKMTEQEARAEYIYTVTIMHAQKMLEQRLITEEEYRAFDTKMKEKYRPISDGLISENNLLCVENRA